MAEDIIKTILSEHQRLLDHVAEELISAIRECADILVDTLVRGNKILIMGNGGSAADAQHFVAELVGRFQAERHALAAICLNSDTSTMTAIGNDYGFERVFSRQIEALAMPGDAVFCISTSGQSDNILSALKMASDLRCTTFGLLGHDGGKAVQLADFSIIVPSSQTARIQEAQITIIHILAQLIETQILLK